MFAGLSGAVCIALGAMAAHALKDKVPALNMEIYETANKYQFYQTFALVIIAFMIENDSYRYMKLAGWFIITGIFLFSLSLYFLALRPLMGISNEEMKWVGMITPFGGVSHIIGWVLIFVSAFRKRT